MERASVGGVGCGKAVKEGVFHSPSDTEGDEDLAARLRAEFAGLGDVGGVFVSSVLRNGFRRVLDGVAAEVWGVSPVYAAVTAGVRGVQPVYKDLSALGVDRWLAMIAARELSGGEGCVVIGAGSALTVDVLAADGRHLGGWIAPGLKLLSRSLGRSVQFAKDPSNLPDFSESLTSTQSVAFGSSTVSCVEGGVLAMVRGIVHQAVQSAGEQIQSPGYYIAGGDASVIEAMLNSIELNCSGRPVRSFVRPALVLDGLGCWSCVCSGSV